MTDEGFHHGEHPIGLTAPTIRYTVAPGIDSQITLQTLPGAACILYRENEPDPAHAMKLYADQEGVVYFHVHPSNESEDVAKVVIECKVEGEVTLYPLELHPNSKPTSEMPAPIMNSPRPLRGNASIRPALSEEDALHLSDEELLKRNYPHRPNPEEAPKAFNTWLRAVSIPATFVEPQTVSRPDISHSLASIKYDLEATIAPTASTTQATSNNWSGFELRGAGPYDWVTGKWYVPSVIAESSTHTYSAFWVGLDGDGTTDLVQSGTEQESININFGFFSITFSTYYAWTEFLPQQPTEQQITNFSIHPGDEIFVEVYIAGAGANPNLNGFFGQFWFENLTTSQFTLVYTPRGTTTVGGAEAVWIMERPTVGGNLPDLADYSSAIMFDAYARRVNSPRHRGYVSYQGDTNLQITMFNGSDTLSTVSPIDAYSMRFSWQNFH